MIYIAIGMYLQMSTSEKGSKQNKLDLVSKPSFTSKYNI